MLNSCSIRDSILSKLLQFCEGSMLNISNCKHESWETNAIPQPAQKGRSNECLAQKKYSSTSKCNMVLLWNKFKDSQFYCSIQYKNLRQQRSKMKKAGEQETDETGWSRHPVLVSFPLKIKKPWYQSTLNLLEPQQHNKRWVEADLSKFGHKK